jgi:hypothetical protein
MPNIDKYDTLANPQRWPWNYVLTFVQYTQEELLSVKSYLDIPSMIRHQTCLTMSFLREHFEQEIDDCLEVCWSRMNFPPT